jgi:hypothetical protein
VWIRARLGGPCGTRRRLAVGGRAEIVGGLDGRASSGQRHQVARLAEVAVRRTTAASAKSEGERSFNRELYHAGQN